MAKNTGGESSPLDEVKSLSEYIKETSWSFCTSEWEPAPIPLSRVICPFDSAKLIFCAIKVCKVDFFCGWRLNPNPRKADKVCWIASLGHRYKAISPLLQRLPRDICKENGEAVLQLDWSQTIFLDGRGSFSFFLSFFSLFFFFYRFFLLLDCLLRHRLPIIFFLPFCFLLLLLFFSFSPLAEK